MSAVRLLINSTKGLGVVVPFIVFGGFYIAYSFSTRLEEDSSLQMAIFPVSLLLICGCLWILGKTLNRDGASSEGGVLSARHTFLSVNIERFALIIGFVGVFLYLSLWGARWYLGTS